MLRKMRWLVVLSLLGTTLLVDPRLARAAARPVAYLTWYGQSCFLLESASGARIVMDPIPTTPTSRSCKASPASCAV